MRGFLRVVPLLLLAAGPATARDFAVYPIGKPSIVHGLEVGAVYFQPIDLEGGLMQPAATADIHLEADIHATKDDSEGYGEGDWRPYLSVSYRLRRSDGGAAMTGTLMPLVAYGSASIGKPHYGDNLKMMGPGRYRLELAVAPPEGGGSFAPFTVTTEFIYAGIGKKGAY